MGIQYKQDNPEVLLKAIENAIGYASAQQGLLPVAKAYYVVSYLKSLQTMFLGKGDEQVLSQTISTFGKVDNANKFEFEEAVQFVQHFKSSIVTCSRCEETKWTLQGMPLDSNMLCTDCAEIEQQEEAKRQAALLRGANEFQQKALKELRETKRKELIEQIQQSEETKVCQLCKKPKLLKEFNLRPHLQINRLPATLPACLDIRCIRCESATDKELEDLEYKNWLEDLGLSREFIDSKLGDLQAVS